MPLYADMYHSYLGSAPSVSNSYSVGLPSSHYVTSPISRLGVSYGSPSYARPAHNFYPPSALTSVNSYSSSRYIPKLTTISETLGNTRINLPHHHHVRRPVSRPVTINTSDIDVSANKYEGKRRLSREGAPEPMEQLKQEAEIGERQMRGTINRNRKVVRLNTIRKRSVKKNDQDQIESVTTVKHEEPPPMPHEVTSWREKIPSELLSPPKKPLLEKSPGEIFLEKFIIRNPSPSSKKDVATSVPPENNSEDALVYPPFQPTNKSRRTSITLQSLEQLPTFSDICQDISSDKMDDDLNAGDLRRRASIIIDEELELFNNLRKGSQSTVTCVLEKEFDTDEEIDSEGNKLKKPKQKVATKVDITNASINDIKDFVESIKEEIEDNLVKKPKINVVLEAVEEISMIPVKIPTKRVNKKIKTNNNETKENRGKTDSGVKMRKKSIKRKPVEENKDSEEKRKSDIDFWGSLDRSETQEFQFRAANVWQKFQRPESQEWVIDIGQVSDMNYESAIEKEKTEINSSNSKILTEIERKEDTETVSSKSNKSMKSEGIKSEVGVQKDKKLSKNKIESRSNAAEIENQSNEVLKPTLPNLKSHSKITKSEDKNISETTKTNQKTLSNVLESNSDKIFNSKPLSNAPQTDNNIKKEKKILIKEKNPLSHLKQQFEILKTKEEKSSKVLTVTPKTPIPKRGILCEKINEPKEMKDMNVPAQLKIITSSVKLESQKAMISVIPEAIDKNDTMDTPTDKLREPVKDFSLVEESRLKTEEKKSKLEKTTKLVQTKRRSLEKSVEDRIQKETQLISKVKKEENKNDAVIIKAEKDGKPVYKDECNNKSEEKLSIRSVVTSDVQHQFKKLAIKTPNAKKYKICDGGGEQTLKIETGKKAKSPETGSRTIDTDMILTNNAHAIISDVAVNILSENQSASFGDKTRKIKTTDTTTAQMHLNDNNAQDNKSSIAVESASTIVTDNKSSAALQKDAQLDKSKAVAMTNVKDADTATQQYTTKTGSDMMCDNENSTSVNNVINKIDNVCNVDDESIVKSVNMTEKSHENTNKEVCDENKGIDTILDATVQQVHHDCVHDASGKFPARNSLTSLTVENDQLIDQLDNICQTDINTTINTEGDNCTLRSSKEAGKPMLLKEDEEQDLQTEKPIQVNKIENSDSNTEETSFSTDCSATEDWSSEESEDEEEKQRLKARENLLLLLRMARNDDTPVAAPKPQKKMLLDLDKMKKCYAKEEKAVITLVAKPKPLWKYVRRNKPHKRRNRKLLEKAEELERLEKEQQQGIVTSEGGDLITTHSDDSQASDANSSTKNSKSSTSSDYTEYYDFSFPYYVKDEDNNLLVNSRLSQRSIDSGIGSGSSEASSSLKDPTGEF